MHRHRGYALAAIGLLSVVAWPAADAFVVKLPDRDRAKRLELLEFALEHDQDFRLVLNQKIKLTKDTRPPYDDEADDASTLDHETRAMLRLLRDDDGGRTTEISPLPVIQRVIGEFAWCGSHVDYAAYVLRTAFTCLTYTYVSLLLELMLHLEKTFHAEVEQGHEVVNLLDKDAFRDAWSALTLFVDKSAVMNGDLDLFADLSYTYADVIFSPGETKFAVMKVMREEIDKIVDAHCVRPDAQQQYINLGFSKVKGSLNRNAEHASVKLAYDKVVDRLLRVYSRFNVRTMSMDNWKQILDFEIPIAKNIQIDMSVDKLLENNALGRAIMERRTLVRKPSLLEEYAMMQNQEDEAEK